MSNKKSRIEIILYEKKDLYSKLKKAIKKKDVTAVANFLKKNRHFSVTALNGYELIGRIFKSIKGDHKKQKSIVPILKLLINRGANVNAKNKLGYTALHLAIEYRMTEVIDLLIASGAKLHVRNKYGNSMMHFLIESDSERFNQDFEQRSLINEKSKDFIEWIIQKGLDVDECTNEHGDTAIHLAAKYKLYNALPILIKHAKDVTIVNDNKMTALQTFAGTVESYFINKKRIPNTPRFINEAELIFNCYKKFLEKGFSVNVIDHNGRTPLHHVLQQAQHENGSLCIFTAESMVKQFTNINARDENGNTVLNMIMVNSTKKSLSALFEKSYTSMARLLISKGANIHKLNKDATSSFLAAVVNDKYSMLKVFKEHGYFPRYQRKGQNLLHYYCKSHMRNENSSSLDRQIVMKVLFNHCNTKHIRTLNARKEDSSNNNYKKVLNLLVNEGLDVNAKDDEGKTPLHYAVQYATSKIVARLLKLGANINSKQSFDGFTPLHVAAQNKREDLIKLLIDKKAEINSKTTKGQTVLHLAIMKWNNTAVEELINSGAHVDDMDDDGFQPLHMAILRKNSHAINKLLEFGAEINDITGAFNLKNFISHSNPIMEHLSKLEHAKLPIDEKLRNLFRCTFVRVVFHLCCLKEIESLKGYMISDRTSLYNLLHMNRNATCVYGENEELEKLIDSTNLKEQFPMYYVLISATYYIAINRKELLISAKQAWYELTNIRLPDLCLYEIFDYLSNASLKVLIDGAKNLSYREPKKATKRNVVVTNNKRIIVQVTF